MCILGNEAIGVDYEDTTDRYAVMDYETRRYISRKSIFEGGGYKMTDAFDTYNASTFDEATARKLANRFCVEYRLVHELDL